MNLNPSGLTEATGKEDKCATKRKKTNDYYYSLNLLVDVILTSFCSKYDQFNE